MPPLDALTTRAAADIKAATASLLNGGSTAAWRTAMERALTVAHTSAYIVGTAERSAGGKVRAWLTKLVGLRALSKDDQKALKAAVSAQLDYLAGFVSAQSGLSDAQTAARAALYSGAVRGTYYGARFPGLPNYPGDGSTPCRTNCKCSVEERADGFYWILHPAEHCGECQQRAAQWAPYKG